MSLGFITYLINYDANRLIHLSQLKQKRNNIQEY